MEWQRAVSLDPQVWCGILPLRCGVALLCVPSVCHLLYSSVIRARSSEQVNSARGVYPYRLYSYSAFQQVVNPYAFSAPVVLSPVCSFVPGVS